MGVLNPWGYNHKVSGGLPIHSELTTCAGGAHDYNLRCILRSSQRGVGLKEGGGGVRRMNH